jgi:hypothetical protein
VKLSSFRRKQEPQECKGGQNASYKKVVTQNELLVGAFLKEYEKLDETERDPDDERQGKQTTRISLEIRDKRSVT